MGICNDCATVVCREVTSKEVKASSYPPPVDAIANGHWIGELPERFKSFTRSDEQCLSLKQLVIYLATVSGSNTKICSHHYIIENPTPIITVLPADIEGCVRMTLVGAFTSEVAAAQRKRFVLQHQLNKEFLETILFKKNVKYMGKEELYDPSRFQTMDQNVAVCDRMNGNQYEVDPKLLRILEFSNTFHNITQEMGEDGEPVATNTINYIIQDPGESKSSDFLVHNTNQLPKVRTIDHLVDCCPFLYVYGRGGYGETRQVFMSQEKYLQRCLKVSTGRFQTHPCFLAVAFNIISNNNISGAQFVSMMINKRWIQNGMIDKATVVQAINYKKILEACEKNATKV